MAKATAGMTEGPLLARSRRATPSGDEISFWKRVGEVRRIGRGYEATFDGDGQVLSPVWSTRNEAAVGRTPLGFEVEFAAVVGPEVVVIARVAVTGRAARMSAAVASALPRDLMRGGGPAPLRSNFRAPLPVRKTRSAA